MRYLPIALLTLVLALTGCSSSLSIEDQTKLIEYEKCLSFVEMIQSQALAVEIDRGDVTTDFGIETSLKDCEKYRP